MQVRDTNLDHDEPSTRIVGSGKVDVGLVTGDVKALDAVRALRVRNRRCGHEASSGQKGNDS